jgi:hypothetical protein
MKLNRILQTAICGMIALAAIASAQTKKPNVLVIIVDRLVVVVFNRVGLVLAL